MAVNSAYLLALGVPMVTLGLIMSAISLLAPYWQAGRGLIDNPVYGLYYYCDDLSEHCHRYDGTNPGAPDNTAWFRVAQIFYPVAVYLALLSAATSWVYVIKRQNGAKVGANHGNFGLLTGALAGLVAALMNVVWMCELHVSSIGIELDFCFYFNWVILPLMVIGNLLVRQAHADYENNDDSVGQYDMVAIVNYGRGQNLALLGSIMIIASLAMSAVSLVSPFWMSSKPLANGPDVGLFYEVDQHDNINDLNARNPWLIFCQVYYTVSTFLILVSAYATLRYAMLRVESAKVGQNIVSAIVYSTLLAAAFNIFVMIAYKFEVFNYQPGMELDFCWYFNLAIIPLLVLHAVSVRQSFADYESKSDDAMSGMPSLPWGQEYLIVLGAPMIAVAAAMSVVSWLAPYWMVQVAGDKVDGLYYYCQDGDCGIINEPPIGGSHDWWRVAQVFYPFASVLALLAAILMIVYLMKRNVCDQMNQTLAHGVFVAANLSALFMLLVTIGYAEEVFVHHQGWKLGFAFYFNYGSILLLVIGGLFIRESRCDFRPNAVAPAPEPEPTSLMADVESAAAAAVAAVSGVAENEVQEIAAPTEEVTEV